MFSRTQNMRKVGNAVGEIVQHSGYHVSIKVDTFSSIFCATTPLSFCVELFKCIDPSYTLKNTALIMFHVTFCPFRVFLYKRRLMRN